MVDAQECGGKLLQVILSVLYSMDNTTKFVSSTQASLPRLRHKSLTQEAGCHAVGDVATLSVTNLHSILDCTSLQQLVNKTNQELARRVEQDEGPFIYLNACKLLASQTKFHAERSCSQRIFHYIVPLSWLPNGTHLEQWWMQHDSSDPHPPPSDGLKKLKEVLRCAESPRFEKVFTKDESETLDIKTAAGRFGSLGTKQRLPWHNFADPRLCGDASPNNEPVWRVLDRARVVRLLKHPDGKHVSAVLEFRGDDFLLEQVRRIVGTAIAMTHEWLPRDTWEVARTPNVVLATTLAPAGRLYLADTRFHFDELQSGGQSIFESDMSGVCHRGSDRNDQITRIQQEILGTAKGSEDNEWLEELQVYASRIKRQLEIPKAESHSDIQDEMIIPLDDEFQCYHRTLQLLRDIINSGSWPETSAARSSVIGNIEKKRRQNYRNGSFTVVNSKFQNGVYKTGIGNNPLPVANKLFPELTKAVFELEHQLILNHSIAGARSPSIITPRPPSSHCAINCNAQFTPHVDSGRGAGQSLSMIVGLGDYSGGEIAVEGQPFDIRYHPLEFDGWHLRHWTLPFRGERFSLVWFTPQV
jgi:tRNA U38,U39,U40 pseudouridine synthase TruA